MCKKKSYVEFQSFIVKSAKQWFLTFFEVREHFWLYEKFAEPKLMIQKTNENMPRRNKYILENILVIYIY